MIRLQKYEINANCILDKSLFLRKNVIRRQLFLYFISFQVTLHTKSHYYQWKKNLIRALLACQSKN